MSKPPEKIVFNGIDALTGLPLEKPLSPYLLASRIRGSRRRAGSEESDLKWWHQQFESGPDRGPAADVDPFDLSSSGWGVIFPTGDPKRREALEEALRPLLEYREEKAAFKNERYYRELEYQPGWSKDDFYKEYSVQRGPAHPDQLPYYLLIVGDPETVPHRFQYLLDMQHAVGRIAFDNLEDYANYARSVVNAERGEHDVLPEMRFFSPCRLGDKATERSRKGLVRPLVEALMRDREEWKIHQAVTAEKWELVQMLKGGATPAFIFAAAHGMGYRNGHPLQAKNQGAIVCQDWPGAGPVSPDQFFAASDIDDHARLHGLIAFLFGCYSAGTPRCDNFPPRRPLRNRVKRSEKAFLSPLAKRLLSHPAGGALAVLGHVDQTWTRTFGTGQGKGCWHVESLVKYILDGYPVGHAMDKMNERFAELSTELTDVLNKQAEPLVSGKKDPHDPKWLSGIWRANNDARNFVVLGDPAVRLVAGPRRALLGGEATQPAISPAKNVNLRGVLGSMLDRQPIQPKISSAELIRAKRGIKD